MKRRALLSVSDKSNLIELAKFLVENDYEIISTGGTSKHLRESNIPVTSVSDVTEFPEILGGRVKTLHPQIHGAILAHRRKEKHLSELKKYDIAPIDLVVVNLYPFSRAIREHPDDYQLALENIDIGGVALLRASAKNHADVIILSDPEDYQLFMENWPEAIDISMRKKWAVKAFQHTAAYDIAISNYLFDNNKASDKQEVFPKVFNLSFRKVTNLRYGENPHQQAAVYESFYADQPNLTRVEQLNGKELSYNNLNDTNSALEILNEFAKPTAVAVKHQNPCGVATGENLLDAYQKTYAADPTSIFGGILALNRKIDSEAAVEMAKIFLEVIVAPDFSDDALSILRKKKNLRLLRLPQQIGDNVFSNFQITKVDGGVLVQEPDDFLLDPKKLNVVTRTKPSEEEMNDLMFAWKVVKHVRSNAIVLARSLTTIGIGPGQTSRIWALENCVHHANLPVSGTVLASDAFFPFGDSVELAHKHGIKAIIQPGGSIRDNESIDLCDKYNISMIFTAIRHFKH